jgi:Domain of unknown function (DUF4249)
MKKIIHIFLVVLLASSCEKVIDIPLNEAEIQVVVEAHLNDIPKGSFVKISKSGSVYDDSGFDKVSGALITVTDNNNNTFNFVEDVNDAGTYLDSTFLALPNSNYGISIVNGSETYTAISSTNSDIAFDSLDYFYQIGGFGQSSADSLYFVFYNFTDNGNEENFYRVVPIINGKRSSIYYLNDDQLFNGGSFRQPFYADEIIKGDTLDVYVYSMDEASYSYFITLSSSQDGGPFSPTPGNPVSNIKGNAIGYFGVFMTDYEQIIFPQ